MDCDPLTGACQLPDMDPVDAAPLNEGGAWKVRYIGDPMCSWCWGIAPDLARLEGECASLGIPFVITVGGLRPGGGEVWDSRFTGFLRHEWETIHQATGQPFGYTLLDSPHFEYDTEPACRAVVTARTIQVEKSLRGTVVLSFFGALQEKFYVHGEDPKDVSFYEDICATHGFEFDEFRSAFESHRMRRSTVQDFLECRRWGVRSFPTVLLEHDEVLSPLSVGYSPADRLISGLHHALRGSGGSTN